MTSAKRKKRSSLSSSSSSADNPATMKAKPNKISRSCTQCYRRKVRCSQEQPSCEACRRHARTLGEDPALVLCEYAAGAELRPDTSATNANAASNDATATNDEGEPYRFRLRTKTSKVLRDLTSDEEEELEAEFEVGQDDSEDSDFGRTKRRKSNGSGAHASTSASAAKQQTVKLPPSPAWGPRELEQQTFHTMIFEREPPKAFDAGPLVSVPRPRLAAPLVHLDARERDEAWYEQPHCRDSILLSNPKPSLFGPHFPLPTPEITPPLPLQNAFRLYLAAADSEQASRAAQSSVLSSNSFPFPTNFANEQSQQQQQMPTPPTSWQDAGESDLDPGDATQEDHEDGADVMMSSIAVKQPYDEIEFEPSYVSPSFEERMFESIHCEPVWT